MQLIKSIKVKILAGFLAAAVLSGGVCFAADAAASGQEQAKKPVVQFSKVLVPDVAKMRAVNEIEQYLLQMDSDDLATTLKMFRVMQLAKAKFPGDVSDDKLFNGAIKGSVNSLGDPYTVYMDPKALQDLTTYTKGSFSGVGMVLGIKDNVLTVIAPIDGTPAERAGIKSGDKVIRINAQETKEMALDEAVNMIRGPEGTAVTLTISRGTETTEYTITRANIQIKTVTGKLLDNGIGYIRISQFGENTGAEFSAKLQELESQGMKAAILDLRNNPGGLVTECVKVAGNFVPAGPVVSYVTKDGTKETYNSYLEKPKYPLAVLVNGGSASASEIVAGAVQDTGAGTLIGTKTFGKGSVQSVFNLGDGYGVKMTIAKYYTPKNRSIHGSGLEPDIHVDAAEAGDEGNDPQLKKAIEVVTEKL